MIFCMMILNLQWVNRGNVLTKGDVIKCDMSGEINQDKVRIVYENDEVAIHHELLLQV